MAPFVSCCGCQPRIYGDLFLVDMAPRATSVEIDRYQYGVGGRLSEALVVVDGSVMMPDRRAEKLEILVLEETLNNIRYRVQSI